MACSSLRGNNGFVGLKNQLEDITMHFVGITLKELVGRRLPVKKTPFQRRCKFAPPCCQPCCLFAGYLDRALTAAGRAIPQYRSYYTLAPAVFAQQCPRCDYSSSEVCRLNFVTLGEGRPWNEETEETLFLAI